MKRKSPLGDLYWEIEGFLLEHIYPKNEFEPWNMDYVKMYLFCT